MESIGGEQLAGGEVDAEGLGAGVVRIHEEAVLAIAAPLALDEALLNGGGEVELDQKRFLRGGGLRRAGGGGCGSGSGGRGRGRGGGWAGRRGGRRGE